MSSPVSDSLSERDGLLKEIIWADPSMAEKNNERSAAGTSENSTVPASGLSA